jgi:hypothetical protein
MVNTACVPGQVKTGCEWSPCGRVKVTVGRKVSTMTIGCPGGMACMAKPTRVQYRRSFEEGETWLEGPGVCVRTCQEDSDCVSPPRGKCNLETPVCASPALPRKVGVCELVVTDIRSYETQCPNLL